MAVEWPSSFALGQKNQNPTAASAASEATTEARVVQSARAEADKNVNGDSVVWLKKRTHRLAGVEVLACGPRCVGLQLPFFQGELSASSAD
ncbi:hypothetical protein SAMN05661099_2858 [Daejeonella lutea]|uniref:Uncharacterized protein n=1 Tax=Daejeonella lutea TaxID=572036 RepID=A0A1T5EBI9_9SPHI|nr:hypothetical protein SAMN05661099_2858 [Daejeonella lutea]